MSADRPQPDPSAELVIVGRLARPHGVRGEMAVEVLSDNPERMRRGSELLAVGRDPEDLSQRGSRALRVAASRPHRGRMLVRFEGIEERDAAEALRGRYLAVPRAGVPAPAADTYYHFQLVGCRCRDVAAGELGTVVDVIEDGGGVLLEIASGPRKLLVPFVRDFLLSVDVEGRRIELELPPGLIETCASTS